MGQRGEEGEGKWAGHLSFPREPHSSGTSLVQTAWPEVCVWHLQTVLGRPFMVSIFQTRGRKLMRGGDLPTFHGRV